MLWLLSLTGPVWAAMPVCDAPLREIFSLAAIAPLAGGSDTFKPIEDPRYLRALTESVGAGSAGRWDVASAAAARAGYTVCKVGDVVVWRAPMGSGRARWALRVGAARPLVLEVPHPVFDVGTLGEGVDIFLRGRARGLLVSGAHRCAANQPSGCSGTTHTCGGGQRPFPISDPAHAPNTTFHVGHVALSVAAPEAVMVSLHGFGGSGVSVSDGTKGAVDVNAPVPRLVRALTARLPGARVSTCNGWPGADQAPRMCGTTNAQGRHLNGSGDVCTVGAERASGRFLHLEQSGPIRRGHLDAVVSAFLAAFELQPEKATTRD